MGDHSTVLSAEHLAKTYAVGFFRKKVKAAQDVSLKVSRGEIFGLLGPNGAGKTTTLKMLLGLVRPSSGKAAVLGRPIGDLGAKARLGYLPESPYFYEYLSGRELLVFMGKLFGLSRVESARRAGDLLEQVDMVRAADLPLRRYSKGMLQRLGLAQALINNPELVILDEPLTGLDPLGRKHLREVIASLRTEGKTVVFSSHILSDVEMLADRVVIVVRGRTVASGRMHELVNPEVLSTEVRVLRASAELVEALEQTDHRVVRQGDRVSVTVDGDGPVDAVLELVQRHDGRVTEVAPRKESLEDVVVRQALAAQDG